MTALAQAGGVAGSLGLALLVLGGRREPRLAGFGGWVFGIAALAWSLAPGGRHGELAGALLVCLPAAALVAVLLVLVPWALPVLALALVPARVAVSYAGIDATLLLPLYVLTAAAALALFWQLAADGSRGQALGPLAWPYGLWVSWTGLSILWSADVHRGAVALLASVLPFGLLAVCLARLPWSRLGVVVLGGELAALGVVVAATGLYQWFTRDLYWRPDALGPGASLPVFRVESVFGDPQSYGRFLTLAILGGLAVALFGATARVVAATVVAVALAWWGLLYAHSQASLAALAAGTLLLAAVVWRRRAILPVLLAAALAGALLLALPHARHVVARHAADRSALVSVGGRVALRHPLLGVGLGGRSPSRDAPVGIAAESGFPGALLWLWLVAAALAASLRRVRCTFAGRAAAAFGIMVVAMIVSSVGSGHLIDDPVFWGVLGLAALAWRARPEEASAGRREPSARRIRDRAPVRVAQGTETVT